MALNFNPDDFDGAAPIERLRNIEAAPDNLEASGFQIGDGDSGYTFTIVITNVKGEHNTIEVNGCLPAGSDTANLPESWKDDDGKVHHKSEIQLTGRQITTCVLLQQTMRAMWGAFRELDDDHKWEPAEQFAFAVCFKTLDETIDRMQSRNLRGEGK